MSSAIWDWVAVLEGFRPAAGTFIPLYWTGPARLALFFGWTPPTPEAVLSVLTVLSLAAVGFFIWKRHSAGLCVASLIWGALLADTPYAILLPLSVWFACVLAVRALYVVRRLLSRWFPRRFGRVGPASSFRTPWGLGCFFAILAFILAVAANFVRFEHGYPTGYLRRAIAAVRWDGFSWSRNALRMDGLLDAYVVELAQEGAGRKWIFTDGLCDSGIELAARGRLRAVSLVGGAISDATARQKGFAKSEDLFALSTGAARLLRAWAVDRPEGLTNAVFLCGFDFLNQVASDRVEPYGLVMRSVVTHAQSGGGRAREGTSTEDAWSVVRALGEGIVAFREAGGTDVAVGRLRSVRFGAMQWRVARAFRRQALLFDRAGRTDEAKTAIALSERLDELNPYAHALGSGADPADSRAFGSLSPREGLAFALKRADFALARRYAKPILEDDPNHAAANFAIAMSHFALKEYALARLHFEKALAAQPGDPALLNNLAMTLLALGELDEARKRATAALKLKPDSSAIRETLLQLDKLKKAAD